MSFSKRILFITHYAGRTGAPIVLKHHLIGLKEKFPNLLFDILLKEGGELAPEFEDIANTYYLPPVTFFSKIKRKLFNYPIYYNHFLNRLLKNDYKIIYGNTVATVDILVAFKKINSSLITICHVHELEMAIKQFCGEVAFFDAIQYIDLFVAASIVVKEHLIDYYQIDEKKISIHYEYIPLPKINEFIHENKNGFNVFGSGTLDWRKGIDLFIQIAYQLDKINPKSDFSFYWIGGNKNSIDYERVSYDIKKSKVEHRVTIIPNCPNPLEYLKEADIFLLTSREDPFPLICLEAASIEKPVMCFKDSGGMIEFVNNENGWLIDYFDIVKVSHILTEILNDVDHKQKLTIKGKLSRTNSKGFDITIGCEKLYLYLENVLNQNQ